MSTEDQKKIWDLIEDNRTCMMVTNAAGEGLRARPMHAIVDGGEILFYTRLSSGKSVELAADGEVCLAFGCPKSSDYVSVTGDAVVSTDMNLIKKHWSKFVDAWFPNGPEGGDVGVIRVNPKAGEYWDGQSSDVLSALKMLIASERDETPDLGENRKVAM